MGISRMGFAGALICIAAIGCQNKLHQENQALCDLMVQSGVTFIATLIGSLIPLTPFFFLPPHTAVIYSVIFSAIALVAVGAYASNQTVKKPFRGGLQMGIIGLGAAFAGYLIGLLLKV